MNQQRERHRPIDVTLSVVLCDEPAINVHGFTYRALDELKYWLRVAGSEVVEVAL